MPQIWYYGTTEKAWDKIKESGSLGGNGAICLMRSPLDASCHGPVILKVQYRPRCGQADNYVKDCWQMNVFIPIHSRSISILKKPIRPTTEMVSQAITELKPVSRKSVAVILWLKKEFNVWP